MFKRILTTVLLGLGLAILLSLVSQYSEERAVSALQQRTLADLNRYVLTMRQKLARYRDIPQLLSTHPDLINLLYRAQTPDALMRANLHLEDVNRILATRDTYLMNPQGLTVASSNWRSERSFIGRNFNFRPYFTTAMAGELGQYFALGTTSNKRGFYYSYPVRHNRQILGVIVVKIDLNEIEQDWNEKETELLISDEDGVIFISTRKDWKFRTLKSLQREDLDRITASRRYGNQTIIPLDVAGWRDNNDSSQIITLRGEGGGRTEQQYLIQSSLVGNSDLNVSILADLESVQREVLARLLFVGTVYLSIVLLGMVIITRHRIGRQRNLFEQRELQALEKNEARVRAIINNTWAGLITLDIQGCVESMNVTAQKLFVYSEHELKGKRFADLLLDTQFLAYEQQVEVLTLSNIDELIEANAKCGDDRIVPIEFVVGQMQQSGTLHYLITVQDITERKQYEAELDQSRKLLETRVEQRTVDLTAANARLLQEITQHRNTQNELIQTAKIAVIGQMSAGINHELNQPLMAIRGYADNARKFLQLEKVPKADGNLAEIALLTERMAKILHPLKEFSRKSSGNQQPVSLKVLRDGVLAILYPRLEKSMVNVVWTELQYDYYVLGDLLRLEQVMVNLVGNAIQAVEDRPEAKVVISQRRIEPKRLQISVEDNGRGIGEDELENIFEPFFTTKKEGQGLGLGLSISQRIIEDIGGQLTAANGKQGGAVFTVDLQLQLIADLNEY